MKGASRVHTPGTVSGHWRAIAIARPQNWNGSCERQTHPPVTGRTEGGPATDTLLV